MQDYNERSMHERDELPWSKTMPWLSERRALDWPTLWSMPYADMRAAIATGRMPVAEMRRAA